MHLLVHSLVAQKSRDSVTEFSVQGLKAETKVLVRLNYWLKVLGKNWLPSSFRLLQNLAPCSCRTEVSVSLLPVGQGLSSAPEAACIPCHVVPALHLLSQQ